MRALLDANVYISYLLSTSTASPPRVVVEAALDGAYELLFTPGVIDEVRRKTSTKPYLARRISQTQVDEIEREIAVIAKVVSELSEPFPEVGRDRKDDYLFAHAVAGQADYLVSGDTGVQNVGQIGNVRIMSPAEFVQVLQRSGQLPPFNET